MKVIHPAAAPEPFLVVSSEQGGNTIADSAAVSMTAPGSPSVVPMADYAADNIPLPAVPAPHDAVFRPDHRPASGNENAGRGDIWQNTDEKPLRGGDMWAEL